MSKVKTVSAIFISIVTAVLTMRAIFSEERISLRKKQIISNAAGKTC